MRRTYIYIYIYNIYTQLPAAGARATVLSVGSRVPSTNSCNPLKVSGSSHQEGTASTFKCYSMFNKLI